MNSAKATLWQAQLSSGLRKKVVHALVTATHSKQETPTSFSNQSRWAGERDKVGLKIFVTFHTVIHVLGEEACQ